MAHVQHNSGKEEWYTPPWLLNKVRLVLRHIELDPCSCEIAQQNVQAGTWWGKEHDGLAQDWTPYRTIFLNPPYRAMTVDLFACKLARWIGKRNDGEAITLTNNATETAWAQTLMRASKAVCFPRRRIKFYDANGEAKSPLQGQMICYLGGRATKFCGHFDATGRCWML